MPWLRRANFWMNKTRGPSDYGMFGPKMWERERLLPLSQERTGRIRSALPTSLARRGCGPHLPFRIRCEGLYGVRKNVLVVAQQIELRARIARVLHSAGYGAELAGNQKRALELAARKDIQAAIVVHSTDLAGLGQKLRGKIPTTILVGHRTNEIVRPGHSLQGTDAFPEDALDEQKLLDQLSELAASPGSKRAPVKIEDCKLDLAGHTFVHGSGREVRLTRAEIALLTAFVDSPRRVLSRDQLRYAVAGRGAEPYDRSVDMLIARLRRKIEPDPKSPRFILSVQGVGYKFDVRPQSAANGEAIDPEQFNRSRRGEAIPASTPGQGSAAPLRQKSGRPRCIFWTTSKV